MKPWSNSPEPAFPARVSIQESAQSSRRTLHWEHPGERTGQNGREMRGRRRSPGGVGAARSDHRAFRSGGGFRRSGPPKASSYAAPPLPPPPPPPPPLPPPPSRRRGDVLLEAGRLAAEYLVAKGLLPAASLPPFAGGRWRQKGGGEEGGRASALSRLGRRRFEDDDDEDDDDGGFGGRKRARRRRNRSGSYGRRGGEWGQENGRGGRWSEESAERGRGCTDAMDDEDLDRSRRWSGRGRRSVDTMEDDDYDRQDRSEESSFGDGGGGREPLNAATNDELLLPTMGEVRDGSELEPENHNSADETGSKATEEIEVNPVPDVDVILKTRSDDVRVINLENEEVEKMKGSVEANGENGLQIGEGEDSAAKSCPAREDKQESNHGVSLLCGFVRAPKKPRSSMANRHPRTDQKTSVEDVRENSDFALKEGGLKNKAEEVSRVCQPNDALTDQFQSPRCPAPEISTPSTRGDSVAEQPQSPRHRVPGVSRSQSAQPVESMECCLMSAAESGTCSKSHLFPECSSAHVQEETSEGPPGFELPGKPVDADDAKVDESPAEHMKREGMKNPQAWSPSTLSKMDEYFHNSRSRQFDMPVKKPSGDHEMVDTTDQNHVDKFPKAVVQSVNKFEEQSQLASTSVKIFDLNLMEAPEITDISNGPVLEHVPNSTASLEAENNPSVSFDLSIRHRRNETGSHGHHSSDKKVVPVIDLEDDSPVDVDACDTSQTRSEPIYPNLENFLNHPENPVGLPNIQDGYGLGMSEFLGNDITGCPAVQGDISDLQTFHGAEDIAGNDDSLYVTLGEIPLNFMEVWDQPPPEYEKFF